MIKCNVTVNLSQNTGKAERKDLSIKPVLTLKVPIPDKVKK